MNPSAPAVPTPSVASVAAAAPAPAATHAAAPAAAAAGAASQAASPAHSPPAASGAAAPGAATSFPFPARTSGAEIELGCTLQPKFGPDGLIPCITVDHDTNEVLMFAFMNAEALAATIRTRFATYWTRSRNKLWVKGEESGHRLSVVDLYVDCDQDVLLLRVRGGGGGACHNGYKSCFYRKLAPGADPVEAASLRLEFAATRVFDPATVYRKK